MIIGRNSKKNVSRKRLPLPCNGPMSCQRSNHFLRRILFVGGKFRFWRQIEQKAIACRVHWIWILRWGARSGFIWFRRSLTSCLNTLRPPLSLSLSHTLTLTHTLTHTHTHTQEFDSDLEPLDREPTTKHDRRKPMVLHGFHCNSTPCLFLRLPKPRMHLQHQLEGQFESSSFFKKAPPKPKPAKSKQKVPPHNCKTQRGILLLASQPRLETNCVPIYSPLKRSRRRAASTILINRYFLIQRSI